MSTQHCSALAEGEARLNVFTNKQGRIVDVVQQLQVGEEEILLLSAQASGNVLREWLEAFVFVEDVILQAAASQEETVLLAGVDSLSVATRWLGEKNEIALGPWELHRRDDRCVLRGFDLCGEDGDAVPSLWLFHIDGETDDIRAFLTSAGVPQADESTYQVLRIAAGVPEAPGEVSDKLNPLELELHDAIHWDKGCYIGQEVISRIDNYGKQSRWIVGVVLDEVPAWLPETGALLQTQNESGQWVDAGALTSVSPLMSVATPFALAWLRTKDFSPSMPAKLVQGEQSVPVRLVTRTVAQSPAS